MFVLSNVLNSEFFKAIPASVGSPEEFIEKVFPKNYEDIVVAQSDGIDVTVASVPKEDTQSYEALIKRVIYTSDRVVFPKFRFTNLKNITYELNQNQVLHLLMCYRFEQFRPMKRPYMNLLTQDVKALSNYMDYNLPNSYNSKIKLNGGVVIIPFKDMTTLSKDFISIFSGSNVSEEGWNAFFTNNNPMPSSLNSITKSCNVVLNDTVSYRAPGYKRGKDSFISIFPDNPNVPARLQAHLINDAIRVYENDISVIQQDNILVEGEVLPKDNTYKKVLTVFHPIDKETCRFMAGEIEVSSSVAETLVVVTKSIEENFSNLNVEEGQEYDLDFKPFNLGTTYLSSDIIIRDTLKIKILEIRTTNINGTQKIYYEAVIKAGNARIVSNTGAKGVTKVCNDLGYIELDVLQEPEELSEDVLKKRYPNVPLETLESYTKQPERIRLYPDMVLGMNSSKAKSNTIALAQACLAVE